MDADIRVAGTVQTDCQVCDSVTVSFLTHGLRHLWQIVCGLSIHSAAFKRGERGRASFGPAAVDGSKFPLSRWSWFCLFRTVDRSFGVTLQPFE